MKGVTIQHAALKGLSFIAKISQEGGSIAIEFKNGKKSKIVVAENEVIDSAMPSVDGRVMYLQLENGGQKFFETATGQRLIPKGGNKNRGREYRPEFYA